MDLLKDQRYTAVGLLLNKVAKHSKWACSLAERQREEKRAEHMAKSAVLTGQTSPHRGTGEAVSTEHGHIVTR